MSVVIRLLNIIQSGLGVAIVLNDLWRSRVGIDKIFRNTSIKINGNPVQNVLQGYRSTE